MQTKTITFDDILDLSGELGIFDSLNANQTYVFLLKISNPDSPDAQKIYKKLLEIQEQHKRIDHNFKKVTNKIVNTFEIGLTDVVVQSKRDQIESTQKKRPKRRCKGCRGAYRIAITIKTNLT